MGSMNFTASDFRSRQSRILDLADSGERVIIRRREKAYAIVPVTEGMESVTPELQAKIDAARKEYAEGKSVRVRSHEELDSYLASL